MPEPDIIQVLNRFKRSLAVLDAVSAAALIDAYGPIWRKLSGDIEALAAKAASEGLTAGELFRLERYRALEAQVSGELARYSTAANSQVVLSQRAAITIARESAKATVDAALPPGLTTGLLGRIGVAWNQVPAEALEAFVGVAGDGSPLATLFDSLGGVARDGVREGLAEGIALGKSPIETAKLVRNRFGVPLTRSLTISRTETLRAFREGSRLEWAANGSVVKGFKRISARDASVCPACIALDGREQTTERVLPTHPNCRCGAIPITVSYRDLGLNVEDKRPALETNEQWFKQQPRETQLSIMGPNRLSAYESGQFSFGDMGQIVQDDAWGDTVRVTPVEALIGRKR